jgi:hypothetical protein
MRLRELVGAGDRVMGLTLPFAAAPVAAQSASPASFGVAVEGTTLTDFSSYSSLPVGLRVSGGTASPLCPGALPTVLLYLSPGLGARWFLADWAGVVARLG